MKIKLLLSTIALCGLTVGSTVAHAQSESVDFISTKKGLLFGFGAGIVDYSASLPHVGKVDFGATGMFWKGLTDNLDLSVRYNGIFTSYTKDATKKSDFANEVEAALHLRALSDDHLFNPFLTAGIAGGTYSGSIVPYAPVGLGLQVNLYSEAYLFLQANYRFSFDDKKLDNSTYFGIGIASTIKHAKAKTPPPPPPPADTDGDGVPDNIDQCPTVAGLARLNGCPDKDGDGIADKDDKCPEVAGVAKYNGCPIPDTDGDGINDEEDKCPNQAGTAKYQGCPIPDTDGDGVNDEMDKCPTVPGPASNRGCPVVREEVKKRLSFAATAIQFETGKAAIKKTSYKLLDEVVAILNEYPDYYMTIDGHTDNVGKADKNLILSKDRAASVKNYFTEKGIADSRIETDGHGDTLPKASNKTAKGRAENRRVEMDLKLKD